jgi:hypothetical protein
MAKAIQATVGRGYATFWATSTSLRIGDAADSRVEELS